MKTILFIFSLISFFTKVYCENNDLERAGLKGRVKTNFESTFGNYYDTISKLSKIGGNKTFFDENGNQTRQLSYNREGKIVREEIVSLDSKGRKIEDVTLDQNHSIQSRILCKYDGDNLIEEIEEDSAASRRSVVSFRYKLNRMAQVKERQSLLNDALSDKEIYIYKNNYVKEIDLFHGCKMFTKIFYSADSLENVTEQRELGNCNKAISKTLNIYNANGKKSQLVQNVIFEHFITKWQFSYNNNDDIVSSEMSWSNGKHGKNGVKQLRYEYTYDSARNWIKKDTFEDNILTEEIVRTIEYY
ncbi:MAG: type secretion protein Rhs [Bacteroidota bacterium]|nr:type secretion protein Rhs [Bacteroidota bacterium]